MRTGGLQWVLAGVSTFACAVAAQPATAAAPACTTISNTAFVQLGQAGVAQPISSNPALLLVDELLDLRLASISSAVTLEQGEPGAASFELINAGNGDEAFVLDGRIESADATIEGFAIDRDGNGVFDAGSDVAIASGTPTPSLAPGNSVRLLALLRGGATAESQGMLHIATRSVTGSGAPGSLASGRGDGGCDAVIGGTTASGAISMSLTVAAGTDTSQIQLRKSQAFAAPDGSATPVRGATVTYAIETRFGGSGVVRSALFADLIPPGTAYLPGSLRLDGTTLTDGTDGDAGSFDGASVRVALGDVPAPATRRIEFKVKIQ